MEQRKKRKPILSLMILAILCIGGMELLFCRVADPVLFDKITTPVINYTQMAWSRTSRFVSAKTAELKSLATSFTAKGADTPEVTESADTITQETNIPVEDPTLTEMVFREGRETLLGGNVDMVFYNQADDTWAQRPYGTDDIGKYGCGPVAMSMVVSSMTVYDVNPEKMAAWAVDSGYWAPKDGSYLSIIPGTAKNYGLYCTSLGKQTADTLRQELAAGGVIVALMGKGHFTDKGHFIILRGVTLSGNILVADPNSRENSLAEWDAQLILDELATGRGTSPLWRITT